eukprot:4734508-Pyramimonas_sp.AAC.1
MKLGHCAAVSLMGRARAGTVSRHSRALTRVLGPGLHRADMACVSVHTVVRQVYHMLLAGIISYADWDFMYQHRLALRAGPA